MLHRLQSIEIRNHLSCSQISTEGMRLGLHTHPLLPVALSRRTLSCWTPARSRQPWPSRSEPAQRSSGPATWMHLCPEVRGLSLVLGTSLRLVPVSELESFVIVWGFSQLANKIYDEVSSHQTVSLNCRHFDYNAVDFLKCPEEDYSISVY